MKLSLIIPIYNAEKYLSNCLDGVSSCPSTEMECILINDGSTDSSLNICEDYAKKDSRFKIINKSNAGVSVARNTGLLSAAGKYVMFLDADDFIEPQKWNFIINAISEEQDFISFSYYTLYQDGNLKEELFPIGSLETKNIKTIRKLLIGSAALNTCWGKLMKLNIIRENNILFRENLKTGEDAIFILEYFKRANTYLLRNESILYYRQHAESAMHKLDIHTKLEDFKELYECRKKMSELWNDDDLKSEMYREFFSVITDLLLKFSLKNKISDCNRVFKKVAVNSMVKDVLLNINANSLRPIYKKIEVYIMKGQNMLLLSSYFKLKSAFM
jgi:glycosyltransferase involved in cell wall biosynthesis